MKELNKKQVRIEQIIAGSLLKFEKIDNLDLDLLISDFVSNYQGEIIDYFDIEYLEGYITITDDGYYSPLTGKVLDSFLKEENITLKEKYEIIATEDVVDYIDKLDLDKFKKKKEEILNKQSKIIKENACILLISNVEEDYKALKDYGFNNIDYFKSLVRANNYFQDKKEDLQKYDIVLIGEYCRSIFSNECWKLINDIKKMTEINKKSVLTTQLYRYDFTKKTEYQIHLKNEKIARFWNVKGYSYNEMFDGLVESAIINNIVTEPKVQKIEYKPIEDCINPERLPLPEKKSDLKILYLDSIRVNDSADEIARSLGLNVKFKEDNNSSLEKNVKSHLGDYDIIIASRSYSGLLTTLNVTTESTEQCKDTGRDLTLLITYDKGSISYYDEDDIRDEYGFGDGIILHYILGGNLSKESEVHEKQFRVLRKNFKTDCTGHFKKYDQSQKTDMQAILKESVNIYNNYLSQIEKPQLLDFDLTTADEYDLEFAKEIEKENIRKQKALEPINNFDSLRYKIENYIYYKKQGLMPLKLEGLKIKETAKGIYVENILGNRVLCSITFSKINKENNLRIFSIQTLTNKGNLGEEEIVGFYTRKYENVEGIPNRPNEQQMNAFLSISKKVNKLIVPLNEKAYDKYQEMLDNEKKRHVKKI